MTAMMRTCPPTGYWRRLRSIRDPAQQVNRVLAALLFSIFSVSRLSENVFAVKMREICLSGSMPRRRGPAG
jgi:hypothetical protein